VKRLFITRRRHDAEVAELRQRALDAEARFDECEGKRRNLARWLAEANAANTRLNGRIKALAGQGKTRTASEVLVEHDVHRKAVADALGDQKRHLNWDQLITEVQRTRRAANGWMADATQLNRGLTRSKKAAARILSAYAVQLRRADVLQARLDDACGLSSPALDWRAAAPRPVKEDAS
jgi:hypothetical protein